MDKSRFTPPNLEYRTNQEAWDLIAERLAHELNILAWAVIVAIALAVFAMGLAIYSIILGGS